MARIRSLHPGFFTDERLVSTSLQARLLFLGIGVEADDKGVFEWKPVTLKMRLFPADNIDVASHLAELVDAGVVMSYEMEGRKYGAIRNFRKHQRPKTPNNVHPITPEVGTYVGLGLPPSEDGEPDGGPFPPKGEKPPQMEDVGGRRGKEEKPSGFSGRASARKPNGFVVVRKTTDAINDVIQEIHSDPQRIGIGGEGHWSDVPMLPPVRAS